MEVKLSDAGRKDEKKLFIRNLTSFSSLSWDFTGGIGTNLIKVPRYTKFEQH